MSLESAREIVRKAKKNNLTKLSLNSEQLTDETLRQLMPEIKELTSLSVLNLSFNKLSDVSFLKDLSGLTNLYLGHNNISDISFLKDLGGLTNLYLDDNKLSNVSFLKDLSRLTNLQLGHNSISDVSSLKGLTALILLGLSENNISDVSFLKDLAALTHLNLRDNNISDAFFLKDLTALTHLNLKNNNISDFSFLKDLKNLVNLNLYRNEIRDLPVNLRRIIVEKGYSDLERYAINEIKSYYKQLQEGEDNIYEAKVLVVGEPKAGKTTLTQKIKDNESWIKELKGKDSDSTIGIVIETFPFLYRKDKNKEITTHFWDFGGQDIQYVLHQYFFTESSLYVLLADGRKELTNFNYWFEIIATLGKDCPVLVVLNENSCKPIRTFNINEFRKEFGESLESIEERSVDFYLDDDGRFETLKTEIQNKVSNLKHIGQPLPKKWVDIRKEIEKIKDEKAYIEKDDYIEICNKCELTNKDYQQQVLDYLHVLGIALNYKTDANLRNKLILKPNWVIDALYVVLKDTKIEADKGMFEVNYVDKLWEETGYSNKDCEILLSLMQKGSFEIAYRLGKSEKFIVPILLPYKPKNDYELEELNPIQTHIKYEFMPKGIVSRLIVRLHKNIVSMNNEQIVWNKGVLLSHHNSIAEVIEREQSKQISIKVIGENTIHNKELLTIIRKEIVDIHSDWFDNRLNFDELVPCVCDVCMEIEDKTFYKLNKLEERIRNDKLTIECENKPYKDVNVYELLAATYSLLTVKSKKTNAENKRFNRLFFTDLIAENEYVIEKSGNSEEKGNIIFNYGTMVINKDIQNSTIDNLIKISNNNQEVIKKIKEAFENFNKTQTQELSDLTQKLLDVVNEKLIETDRFNESQIEEFEEVKRKYSNETKLKVKQSIPFEWFIKQFTGFSAEIEKEWKTSKEIDPDVFIAKFRNLLYGANVEENLLELKD